MGSERDRGAGKSLDALVRAFRESPFAVFVPEKFSAGVFERGLISSAELVLISLPTFPSAVRDFFSYMNREISLCDYGDSDGEINSLSRVQFNMAFSSELPSNQAEYKYRLERGRDYLPFYVYGGMTERVLQMIPGVARDFYAKIKHGQSGMPTTLTLAKNKVPRVPRNGVFVPKDRSLAVSA